MKITIIGTGNAGCAHAFKLSQMGHKVSLVKTSRTYNEINYEMIEQNGGLYGIDSTLGETETSFQSLDLITRDLRKGLEKADVVFIMTQSLPHKDVAKVVIPNIDSCTKLLIVIPGNLGSLFYFNKIKQNKDIIIAEGESTPYDARLIEPGVVQVLFKNCRNAVSFLPKSKCFEGINILNTLIPTYVGVRTNIVESALHNPNLVVHTVGVIMSASRIEMMKGDFWMYKESFSPAIWNIIQKLDFEKNSVIEAYGGVGLPYLEACKYRNEENVNIPAYKVFESYANSGGPKGPDSLSTRYLYEDVQLGLCTLKYLGELANVETPITNSLINIASCLVNTDFVATTRKLDSYGLDHMSFEEFKKMVNE